MNFLCKDCICKSFEGRDVTLFHHTAQRYKVALYRDVFHLFKHLLHHSASTRCPAAVLDYGNLALLPSLDLEMMQEVEHRGEESGVVA